VIGDFRLLTNEAEHTPDADFVDKLVKELGLKVKQINL
jgi:hypothetical protein